MEDKNAPRNKATVNAFKKFKSKARAKKVEDDIDPRWKK